MASQRNYMNKILKSSLYIIVAIFVGITVSYAGSTLTAPHSPSKTMHSLSDIYNLITPEEGYEPTSTYQAPTGTPEPTYTMPTLETIYTDLSNEIAQINPGVLLVGNSVFGIVGEAPTATNYGIPQTGQTYCNEFSNNYNTSSQVDCIGTNQDGDLQKGITLLYNDNGNGTITDHTTGLMWQKCADGQDPLTCVGTANTFFMDDGNGISPAINYCENLSLDDYTDWHLPNVKQLQSIVDYGRVSPAINTYYFPNTWSYDYWTSTAYLDYNDSAWTLDFSDGSVGSDNMGNSYFVRCVR